jgi:hypothetical protein
LRHSDNPPPNRSQVTTQARFFISSDCSQLRSSIASYCQLSQKSTAALWNLSSIKEIDGDRYELLDPARALDGKHPLAAVLLRRALIEVTLQKGRATRYKHAVRHVREIDSLNVHVKDHADFETHDQFMARLLRAHPRKTGFWRLLRGRSLWVRERSHERCQSIAC